MENFFRKKKKFLSSSKLDKVDNENIFFGYEALFCTQKTMRKLSWICFSLTTKFSSSNVAFFTHTNGDENPFFLDNKCFTTFDKHYAFYSQPKSGSTNEANFGLFLHFLIPDKILICQSANSGEEKIDKRKNEACFHLRTAKT